jgi:hypothetical protein
MSGGGASKPRMWRSCSTSTFKWRRTDMKIKSNVKAGMDIEIKELVIKVPVK